MGQQLNMGSKDKTLAKATEQKDKNLNKDFKILKIYLEELYCIYIYVYTS